MDVSKLSDIRREISKRNYVGNYLSDIIEELRTAYLSGNTHAEHKELRTAYLSGNTHAEHKEVESNGCQCDPAGN